MQIGIARWYNLYLGCLRGWRVYGLIHSSPMMLHYGSGFAAHDLFEAGKLEVVAEKVDQLLTGDFGG
jgi:hypothetical protein